ncbi:unnamed protein product [Bemisia tabaci]|uniref:C2H2-type domain-containing protein n=1 Tax=Bemisia tabaci TaxID=7038 RepID=A0A9P0AFD1_BEMTA|nr:unnamed protein product [Bemisia tabaci]
MAEPEVCTAESEADSGMVVDGGAASNEETESGALALVTYDSSEGGMPIHRCERCDYETYNHTALAAHTAQCQGGDSETTVTNNRKMFECDVCNMKFSNGANMRRHKMRHTGVKPYECRVCQKRFFRKDHLAEHFTTHTKTLPYHCPICNRGFQRQIAMRAHFQNEHVGQHDMIKSCPLCSFQAGSMKSLRVHFFNRHGIDLDNPGPNLLGNNNAVIGNNLQLEQTTGNGGTCSDSGDSTGARSENNATPPMHFLTPHVEISMADAPQQPATPFSPVQARDQNTSLTSISSGSDSTPQVNGETPPTGTSVDCPSSPQSADSNSNTPVSSSLSVRADPEVSPITPSVSLIPIKQELDDEKSRLNGPVNLSTTRTSETTVVRLQSATSTNSLSSFIKVSPLKSLLREDLKRRGVSARLRQENSPTSSSQARFSNDQTPPPQESVMWRCRNLQCLFCGIGFPDQTLYFLHKGCHSDANPWKCNICGEQCCNVYEFNSHLLSKSHQ